MMILAVTGNPMIECFRTVVIATALLMITLPASAQDKVRVLSLPILDVGALFYAADQGIFAKHGIEIAKVTTTGGAAGVPAMIGGEADIIYGATVTAILARAQNLPVKVVAAAAVSLPHDAPRDYVAMVTAPEAGVRNPSDLVGKRMLVNTLNNLNHLYTMAWLDQQGVDFRSVQFTEAPFPDQPNAVLSGKAAATMIGAPFLQAMEQKGAEILGWPYRAQSLPVVVGSYMTTDQFAQSHPDTIRRFAAGLNEAIREISKPENREKVVTTFAANTRMTPELVSTVTLPIYTSQVNLDSLQQTADLARKFGLLKNPVNLSSLLLDTAR
jgi:NitT/TauT family transport system substrate-binding protein